jgi:hypothetical protein
VVVVDDNKELLFATPTTSQQPFKRRYKGQSSSAYDSEERQLNEKIGMALDQIGDIVNKPDSEAEQFGKLVPIKFERVPEYKRDEVQMTILKILNDNSSQNDYSLSNLAYRNA